ncbi:glycosyltransferase family 2 protein [Candidatus Saccharibacteria bacterium]|nr:glycosyltransferase family 2 protein [Candidatus Saccharibacteria bacterium]
MIVAVILFWVAAFMIFWANIGYPISILLIGKIIHRKEKTRAKYEPTVTVMIVAHNEEKVIEEKILNVLNLDYPKNKLSVLVTSDNSDDKTNSIVKKMIKKYPERNITLYEVKERKGKTNAQNEAARIVESEVLVMTDANAMLDKNAARELVKFFTKDVAYVSGRLVYSNSMDSLTSNTENTYWDLETKIRQIESDLQTITAGNGALYAIKTKAYHDFPPIRCHDAAMPLYYSLEGRRAVTNNKAIAYEKAGEKNSDEFKRKVRMSRGVAHYILPSIKILNVFKYKWFTYFYLGHRTSRNLLWFNHILLFVSNAFLVQYSVFYLITFIVQLAIYAIAMLHGVIKTKSKLLTFISYYCMTVLAQFIGVLKTITKKNKPFWEKAESTR